ncbi:MULTISPECIES: SapB/AmfS family lanthipeptide [Microbacterium]
MGYLLSLQALEQRESERTEAFGSAFSLGACYSAMSTSACVA